MTPFDTRIKALRQAQKGDRPMRRFAMMLSLALLVTGCTSITVKPIEATTYPITLVCIQDNQRYEKSRSEVDLLGILEDGFQRHGIRTRVVTTVPPDCRYTLSYTSITSWDFTTYLTHAELRLKDGDHLIGTATYHNYGGLTFTKFASAKSKMDPVIDELLSGFPLRQ